MLWARNALSFKLRRLSGEVMESRRAVWWCAVVLSVLRVSERDGPKFSPFPIYSVAGGERKPGVGGGGEVIRGSSVQIWCPWCLGFLSLHGWSVSEPLLMSLSVE